MRWRPLAIGDLPRVSARGAAAVLGALARLGEPGKPMEITSAPFGRLSISCHGVTVARQPGETDSVWRLSRDEDEGWLVMDGLGALRLVMEILGLPAPRVQRPLGAAERGVLTAAIAALLRAIAREVVVSSGSGGWRGDRVVRVMVRVESVSFREQLAIDVPPEWIPRRSDADLMLEAVGLGLEIPLSIEVATTRLRAQEWSGARPGDAVVFDRQPSISAADDWNARLICGRFFANVLLTPGGQARVLSPFESAAENPGETMVNDDRQDPSDTVLASAPIEVIAEIGRITLRADELLGLQPGAVFALGPLRPTRVELRVGNRVWGRGELVDVEGQLGVRLTALTRALEAATPSDAETVRQPIPIEEKSPR